MVTVESEHGLMTGSYVEIGPLWGKRSTQTVHAAADGKTKCGLPMEGRQAYVGKKICRRCFRA